MNRQEIQLLQQVRAEPALTITLPTHRTAPENRQDPILLRNLVDQAGERLRSAYGKREMAPLLERLEKLSQQVDLRHTLDGLALFVSADLARAVTLPFTLRERIHIGGSFLTRDLVFAMNRTPRYWVLALSEKPTRLYEAARDDLTEVQGGGFPLVHEGPGGAAPLPGGFGIKRSAYRDEYARKFFRQVNSALKPFLQQDPLPVAVVGVDRHLAFFHEVSDLKEEVVATVRGSHDKTSAHELGRLVWEPVREGLARQRQEVLAELEAAVGERKSVSAIGEVWRAAHEGRGRLLLVEKDYHYPARVEDDGRTLVPAAADALEGAEDAVDAVIETVLAKQGRVVFLEDGQLQVHQRIALVLRY